MIALPVVDYQARRVDNGEAHSVVIPSSVQHGDTVLYIGRVPNPVVATALSAWTPIFQGGNRIEIRQLVYQSGDTTSYSVPLAAGPYYEFTVVVLRGVGPYMPIQYASAGDQDGAALPAFTADPNVPTLAIGVAYANWSSSSATYYYRASGPNWVPRLELINEEGREKRLAAVAMFLGAGESLPSGLTFDHTAASGVPSNDDQLVIGFPILPSTSFVSGQDVTFDYQAAAAVLDAASGSFTLSGQTTDLLRGLVAGQDAGSFTLSGQDAGFARGLILEAEAAAGGGEITFVGSWQSIWWTGAGTVGTVDFTTLTGGTLQDGDYVLAIAVQQTASVSDRNFGTTEAGWTKLVDAFANDVYEANLGVFGKFWATGDPTTVEITGFIDTDRCVLIAYVLRGVDQTNPIDVATTTATGVDNATANPPSITPVTPGAKVLAVAGGASGGSASDYTHSELTNLVSGRYGSAPGALGAVGIMPDWDGVSAVDPVAFGGGSSATSSAWTAATIALRPSPAGAGFAVEGQDAAFLRGFLTEAATGSFTLSGQDQTYLRDLIVEGGTGAFTLSGQATTFSSGLILFLDTGEFTLSGQATTLLRDLLVEGGTGAFTLSGQATTLPRGYIVGADAGEFTLSGQAASFSAPFKPLSGSFILVGNGVTFVYSQPENVTVTGASGQGVVGSAYYTVLGWGDVAPNQSAGYNALSPSQSSGWVEIEPSPPTSWSELDP